MSTISNKPNQDKQTAFNPDEHIQSFWKKYGTPVIIVLVAVIVIFLGRIVYNLTQQRKDNEIQLAYAAIKSGAGTELALRDFVLNYSGHPLVGVAQLRLGDIAYQAGNYENAAAAYTQAIPLLEETPIFSERAQLGQGVSLLQANKTTEGKRILNALLSNPNISAPIRGDAGYQLALQADKDGQVEEARILATQVLAIEGVGSAAQRAIQLLNNLPAEADNNNS